MHSKALGFFYKYALILLVFLIAGCNSESLPQNHITETVQSEHSSKEQSEWSEIISPFVSLGDELVQQLPDPGDSEARHELYEFIFSQIASGYVMLFYSDPANPDWWPLFSHVFDALWANPDTVYFYTLVDSAGSYRLYGDPGKAMMADLQLGGGQFITEGITEGGMGEIPANIPLDSFDQDNEGNFDVIISPERPPGYTGNWVKMPTDTTYFLIRQVSYDWKTPQANVAIERLDTPARGSKPTEAELKAQLKQLAIWTENWVKLSFNIAKNDRAKSEKSGNFELVDWQESAFGDQLYYVYAFDLAEDEAVIVENKVPAGCSYWSYQLVTDFWRAINPLKHQSNLNPVTGHIDSDGFFRAVIADQDPGVANWLDVGGNKRALVYARFKGCSDAQLPTSRVVKLSEVEDQLPEDTRKVTPGEREQLLRERSGAAQMRRRW